MSSEWERGIIVGKTDDGRTYYLTSSYEILKMHINGDIAYKIGDCIEFLSRLYSGRTINCISERIVAKHRKCDDFVDFKIEENQKSCLLICDVKSVEEKLDDDNGGFMRVIRTEFLEKVFDFRRNGTTAKYTRLELKQMRIVCKRVTDKDYMRDCWIVTGVVPKDPNRKTEVDVETPSSSSNSNDLGNNNKNKQKKYQQQRLKGFVVKIGSTRKELYVWTPYRNRDYAIEPNILKPPLNEGRLYGRWISFSVNRSDKIDENSCVEIIDDVMPTRRNGVTYEIRMPCFFDPQSWDGEDYPVVESYEGGNIADASNVLRRYNRLGGFDNDEAWVYSLYMFDPWKQIRFVLSNRQSHWDSDDDNGWKRNEYNRNRERLQSNDNYDRNEGYQSDRENDRRYNENTNRGRSRSYGRYDGYRENQLYNDDEDDKYEKRYNSNTNRIYSPSPTRYNKNGDYQSISSGENFGKRCWETYENRVRSRSRCKDNGKQGGVYGKRYFNNTSRHYSPPPDGYDENEDNRLSTSRYNEFDNRSPIHRTNDKRSRSRYRNDDYRSNQNDGEEGIYGKRNFDNSNRKDSPPPAIYSDMEDNHWYSTYTESLEGRPDSRGSYDERNRIGNYSVYGKRYFDNTKRQNSPSPSPERKSRPRFRRDDDRFDQKNDEDVKNVNRYGSHKNTNY